MLWNPSIRYRDTIYVAAWVVTLHTVLTGQTDHVKIILTMNAIVNTENLFCSVSTRV